MNIYDVQGSHKKFTEIGVKASLCLHPPSTTRPPSIHATPHLTLGHSDHSRHKDTKTTLYNFSVMRDDMV